MNAHKAIPVRASPRSRRRERQAARARGPSYMASVPAANHTRNARPAVSMRPSLHGIPRDAGSRRIKSPARHRSKPHQGLTRGTGTRRRNDAGLRRATPARRLSAGAAATGPLVPSGAKRGALAQVRRRNTPGRVAVPERPLEKRKKKKERLRPGHSPPGAATRSRAYPCPPR